MISISDFRSSSIAAEYQSFFKAELSGRNITTDHSLHRLEKQYDAIILPEWESVDAVSVTTDYICDIYRSADWSHLLNGCAITTRFIHRLIANGIIHFDASDLFEAYYPFRLSTHPQREEIIAVLAESRFRDYFSAGLPNDPWGTRLSFFSVASEGFADQKVQLLLSAYLEEIKLDTSVASLSRFRSGTLLCKLAKQHFSSLCLQDLDRFQLAEIIRSSPSQDQVNVAKLVKHFILYCINAGTYSDQRFDFYKRFELYLSNAPLDVSLHILSAEDTDKYHFVTMPYSKDRLLIYINSSVDHIRDVIASSLGTFQKISPEVRRFLANFESTLPVEYRGDILTWDYNSFLSQISYGRDTLHSQDCVAFVIALYNYIFRTINPMLFRSNGIDAVILNRTHLSGELFAGIPIITYSPSGAIPESNKFILHYIGNPKNNSDNYPSKSVLVDLSVIQHHQYANLVKDYLWHALPGLPRRIAACQKANQFFSYVEKLKNGEILTLQHLDNNSLTIGMAEIVAFKSHLHEMNYEPSSFRSQLRTIHSLLSYGCTQHYDWIQENALIFLNAPAVKYTGGHPVPSQDLDALIQAVTHFAPENTKQAVASEVIYLLLTTELRLSAILALSHDCVREASKPGEYVIISKSKTSGGDTEEVPITALTAQHLLTVAEKTSPWRTDCTAASQKTLLFLIPAHRKGHFTPLHTGYVRSFLQKCCKFADIDEYTPSNLRDTYITRAQEYRIRNGLSIAVQNMLTGHKSVDIDTEHYVGIPLISMLQATYGVVIGDPTVPGTCQNGPLPDDQSTYVSNNCGYCSNDHCDEYSYIDCLLCKHFVATASNIPFFKDQIAILQSKLPDAETPHDREDLNAKIRLLVAYLSHLYTL